MLKITTTEAWKNQFPDGKIGLLECSGVDNTRSPGELENIKKAVISRLRDRYRGFTRQDFLQNPVLSAYSEYYRAFRKTYHVLLQVESIVMKGKDLPRVSLLVDANFAAEVETLILTAAHDVAQLVGDVVIDVSVEGDRMTRMDGSGKELYPGDMVMRDGPGICCSIIYGQDNRSPVTPRTSRVLYVAYAPPGVPADCVERHLQKVEEYISQCSTTYRREQLRILTSA